VLCAKKEEWAREREKGGRGYYEGVKGVERGVVCAWAMCFVRLCFIFVCVMCVLCVCVHCVRLCCTRVSLLVSCVVCIFRELCVCVCTLCVRAHCCVCAPVEHHGALRHDIIYDRIYTYIYDSIYIYIYIYCVCVHLLSTTVPCVRDCATSCVCVRARVCTDIL
jgi:hypothetical protein